MGRIGRKKSDQSGNKRTVRGHGGVLDGKKMRSVGQNKRKDEGKTEEDRIKKEQERIKGRQRRKKAMEREEIGTVREAGEAERLMVLLELIGIYLTDEGALSGRIVQAACEEVRQIWQREREKADAAGKLGVYGEKGAETAAGFRRENEKGFR
jgi:hypothetical protein